MQEELTRHCKYLVRVQNYPHPFFSVNAAFRFPLDAVKFAKDITWDHEKVFVARENKVIWYSHTMSRKTLHNMLYEFDDDYDLLFEIHNEENQPIPEDLDFPDNASEAETVIVITENQEGCIDNPIVIED